MVLFLIFFLTVRMFLFSGLPILVGTWFYYGYIHDWTHEVRIWMDGYGLDEVQWQDNDDLDSDDSDTDD